MGVNFASSGLQRKIRALHFRLNCRWRKFSHPVQIYRTNPLVLSVQKPLKLAVHRGGFVAILTPVQRNLPAWSYNWHSTDCGTRRSASCSDETYEICVRGGLIKKRFVQRSHRIWRHRAMLVEAVILTCCTYYS